MHFKPTHTKSSSRPFTMIGIGIVRNRSSRATVALAAASLSILLAGCGGGGGGGSTSPNGSSRAAALTTVRGARGASTHLAGNPASFLGSGERTGRKVTRALHQARVTRQAPDDIFFDEDNNLWGKLDTNSGEQVLQINYFKDEAATQPAGFVKFEFQGDPEQYPVAMKLTLNITAGNEPVNGNANITMTSETVGSFKGSFTDLQSGESVAFDLSFNENNVSTGNFTVSEGGRQYKFENLQIKEDGSLTSQIKGTNLNGNLTLNADESGTLTLAVTGGQVTANWNPAGAGTLRFPDGTTQTIADFDTTK